MTFGGAERVLQALHQIWPQAPVFVSLADSKFLTKHKDIFTGWDIRPSWFQKLPANKKLISPLRFLLPYIWESFDLKNYRIVFSSSAWAMSKGVLTLPKTLHICYCHTPPRFLYGYPQARQWQKNRLVKIYASLVNHKLRSYDYISSQRVDYFIANSREVAKRIEKFWRRPAKVIYPPIVLPDKPKSTPKDDFYLYVSRLVSYKHPLLAIRAFKEIRKRLIIVGNGPLRRQVVNEVADAPFLEYRGYVSDKTLTTLYQKAKAVIFPAESEDLGLVPLEAAAYGTPTIGYYSGGVKETIVPGKTGLFFTRLTRQALIRAVKDFENKKWSSEDCYAWARNFRRELFQKKIIKFVKEKLKEKSAK